MYLSWPCQGYCDLVIRSYRAYGEIMGIVSVDKFRDDLKIPLEQVINRHKPLKVTRRVGEALN